MGGMDRFSVLIALRSNHFFFLLDGCGRLNERNFNWRYLLLLCMKERLLILI